MKIWWRAGKVGIEANKNFPKISWHMWRTHISASNMILCTIYPIRISSTTYEYLLRYVIIIIIVVVILLALSRTLTIFPLPQACCVLQSLVHSHMAPAWELPCVAQHRLWNCLLWCFERLAWKMYMKKKCKIINISVFHWPPTRKNVFFAQPASIKSAFISDFQL